MLTLLSPAKTLDFETPATTTSYSMPSLLEQSADLIDVLKQMAPDQIASLMKLSPALANLNADRFQQWQMPFTPDNAKAALLAFKGDVYTGLQAERFDEDDLQFAQQHVRILSGLYGVLRPLDLIQPYRLEMGTKLSNVRGANLYQFWGDRITQALNQTLQEHATNTVVNLASNEYFKSVQTSALQANLVTPIFKDEKNGQYKIISFYAKKARGMMAAFVVKQRLDRADGLKEFTDAGYRFSEESSDSRQWVFKRAEKDIPHD